MKTLKVRYEDGDSRQLLHHRDTETRRVTENITHPFIPFIPFRAVPVARGETTNCKVT